MLFFPLLLLAGLSTGQDIYPAAVQPEFAPPADLAPVADLAQPSAAADPPTIWIDHRSANPDKGPVPATLQYQPANPDTSHSSVPVYQTTDVDYGQWQPQPLADYDAYASQPQPLGTYYPPQQPLPGYQPPARDLGYPSVGGGIGASFPSGLLNPHNLFVWGLGALIIMLTVNVLYDVITKLTAGPLATARDWFMTDDLVNEAAGRSLGNMAGYVMNAIDKYSQLDE